MQKDFDEWNKIKKNIDIQELEIIKFPQEGEVWMSSVGLNIGFEQNGSGKKYTRPTLIIKRFNNHMFWIVPLSTKQKKLNFYFNFTDPVNKKVSVIIAQMKLISIKRIRRKLYTLNQDTFFQIRNKIKMFL